MIRDRYNARMQTAAIVTGIRTRLNAALAPPKVRLRPFIVDDGVVGWIDDARARRLAAFDQVLSVAADHVRLAPRQRGHRARTEAMEHVARELSAEGALSAWRNERYAVVCEFGEPAVFDLERSAARYFGIRTFAAHINGVTNTAAGLRMWFGRRSPRKAVDPGMLDNLVGGGIAAGATVAATVVKEAWEEAGIPAALAATAIPAGALRICRAHPYGLERETVFAHDLMLAPDFVPTGVDGEVVEFRLETIASAARLIANESDPDVVTVDASLVVVDWLLRHGALHADTADRAALAALCHASLDLSTSMRSIAAAD
jgi:8-oxo-dGTP pyrophosphatase MutT (NUDIX family)